MKQWCFLLLLAFSPLDGFQRIAYRNQYAQQAATAYQQQRYQEAAFLYERIRQATNGDIPTSMQLNLAHAYFHLKDYSHAAPLYQGLLANPDISLKSVVAGQLAVIEARQGEYTKALAFCKQALKTDETNQEARYNYELLQKYLILHPEKKNSPPPPQKRDRTPDQKQGGSLQPDNQGHAMPGGTGGSSALPSAGSGTNAPGTRPSGPNPDGSGAPTPQPSGSTPGNTPGVRSGGNQGSGGRPRGTEGAGVNDTLLQTRRELLQKMQMTPEKARQLLDAMRQEEVQYLQQLPRRKATKPSRGTPDW